MGLPTDQAKAVSVQTSQVQSPKERKNKAMEGGTSCVNIQFVPGMFSRPHHTSPLFRLSRSSISLQVVPPCRVSFLFLMELFCKKAAARQKKEIESSQLDGD